MKLSSFLLTFRVVGREGKERVQVHFPSNYPFHPPVVWFKPHKKTTGEKTDTVEYHMSQILGTSSHSL